MSQPSKQPANCSGCKHIHWFPKTDLWGCVHPEVKTEGTSNRLIGVECNLAFKVYCKGERKE